MASADLFSFATVLLDSESNFLRKSCSLIGNIEAVHPMMTAAMMIMRIINDFFIASSIPC